jgi:antitoxin Phd
MTKRLVFPGKLAAMDHWRVHDAKARFGEFLDDAVEKVTRRGVETAVLVSIEEWNRLKMAARPSLKELLLGPSPRFYKLVPERGKLRSRPVIDFE